MKLKTKSEKKISETKNWFLKMLMQLIELQQGRQRQKIEDTNYQQQK